MSTESLRDITTATIKVKMLGHSWFQLFHYLIVSHSLLLPLAHLLTHAASPGSIFDAVAEWCF